MNGTPYTVSFSVDYPDRTLTAILFDGRYRDIFGFVEGVARWHNRVIGYALTHLRPPAWHISAGRNPGAGSVLMVKSRSRPGGHGPCGSGAAHSLVQSATGC